MILKILSAKEVKVQDLMVSLDVSIGTTGLRLEPKLLDLFRSAFGRG